MKNQYRAQFDWPCQVDQAFHRAHSRYKSWTTTQASSIYYDCYTESSSVESRDPMETQRFFKMYANLPLNIREEVILVIDGEPISWRIARVEIESNTEKGRRILEKLIALEII